MASFEIDVDVDEIYYEMSNRERKEMYELLKEDFEDGTLFIDNSQHVSIAEWEYNNILVKLKNGYLNISNEDTAILKQISDKF